MKVEFIAIILIIPVVLFAAKIDDILKVSEDLKTVSCHIYAENHTIKNKVSVVEFDFRFKRPGKMRIDYTYPKSMKGSFVAVDGRYFYNYVASLNRKMKKRITGKKNPGKDLGIIFNYVAGDLREALSSLKLEFVGEEVLRINSKEVKTYHFSFTKGDERQEVWFDSINLFPVKLEIYVKGKLKSVFKIWNVRINVKIDDSIFSPW